MDWLLKIISILIILDGIILVFKPALFKKFFEIIGGGKMIYFATILKTIVGTIFLFGASKSKLPIVFVIAGILALAGAVFIVLQPKKAKAIGQWFASKNIIVLRLLAVIYLLIGAFLMYSS